MFNWGIFCDELRALSTHFEALTELIHSPGQSDNLLTNQETESLSREGQPIILSSDPVLEQQLDEKFHVIGQSVAKLLSIDMEGHLSQERIELIESRITELLASLQRAKQHLSSNNDVTNDDLAPLSNSISDFFKEFFRPC